MSNSLLDYVGDVVDTALSPDRRKDEIHPGAMLVGWQCGFEPHVVAVIDAYDGMAVGEDEAMEIATNLLSERNWFSQMDEDGNPPAPDYVEEVTQSMLDAWQAED